MAILAFGKRRATAISRALRCAVPSTEIARNFRDRLGRAKQQLDFVYILEGRENELRAVIANADALSATVIGPMGSAVAWTRANSRRGEPRRQGAFADYLWTGRSGNESNIDTLVK